MYSCNADDSKKGWSQPLSIGRKVDELITNSQKELRVKYASIQQESDPYLKNLALAEFYKSTGNYDSAFIYSNKVVSFKPTIDAINLRGVVSMNIGLYADAIEDFNNVLLLDSLNASAIRNKALAYNNSGNIPDAIKMINRVFEIDSLNAQSFMCKGIILINSNNTLLGGEYLKIAVEKDSSLYEAKKHLVQCLARRGEINKAIELQTELVERFPLNNEMRKRLGGLYKKKGFYAPAEKEYVIAVHLDSLDYKSLYEIGFMRSEKGNYEMASIYMERATVIDPQDVNKFYDLAIVYAKLPNLEKAIETCERGIAVDSTDGELYYVKGNCYGELKENDKACEDLQKAFELGKMEAAEYTKRYCF